MVSAKGTNVLSLQLLRVVVKRKARLKSWQSLLGVSPKSETSKKHHVSAKKATTLGASFCHATTATPGERNTFCSAQRLLVPGYYARGALEQGQTRFKGMPISGSLPVCVISIVTTRRPMPEYDSKTGCPNTIEKRCAFLPSSPRELQLVRFVEL